MSELLRRAVALLCVSTTLVEGSHYRGDTLSWSRSSPNDTTVTVRHTHASRTGSLPQNPDPSWTCTRRNSSQSLNFSTSGTIAEAPGYDFVEGIGNVSLDADGVWDCNWTTCCRIAGLENAGNTSDWLSQVVIDLRGGNLGGPSIATAHIVTITRPFVTLNFGATDTQSSRFLYAFDLNLTAIESVPMAGGLAASLDPNTGVFTWNTSATEPGELYVLRITATEDPTEPSSTGTESMTMVDVLLRVGTEASPTCTALSAMSTRLELGTDFVALFRAEDPAELDMIATHPNGPPGTIYDQPLLTYFPSPFTLQVNISAPPVGTHTGNIFFENTDGTTASCPYNFVVLPAATTAVPTPSSGVPSPSVAPTPGLTHDTGIPCGNCNTARPVGQAGCDVAEIEQCVCDLASPYCCETHWNEECVSAALFLCDYTCDDTSLGEIECGNCVGPRPAGEAGCDNAELAQCVCRELPNSHCCDTHWDEGCASIAPAACTYTCIDAAPVEIQCGNCADARPEGEHGCEVEEIQNCVCNIDPSCCFNHWDDNCAAWVRLTCDYTCLAPVAEPAPAPTEMPSPEPTPMQTDIPSPEPTPMQTDVPSPEPTPMTTSMPSPEPTPMTTEMPSPEPNPMTTDMPSPEPTPTETNVPSPEPIPVETGMPSPMPTRASLIIEDSVTIDNGATLGSSAIVAITLGSVLACICCTSICACLVWNRHRLAYFAVLRRGHQKGPHDLSGRNTSQIENASSRKQGTSIDKRDLGENVELDDMRNTHSDEPQVEIARKRSLSEPSKKVEGVWRDDASTDASESEGMLNPIDTAAAVTVLGDREGGDFVESDSSSEQVGSEENDPPDFAAHSVIPDHQAPPPYEDSHGSSSLTEHVPHELPAKALSKPNVDASDGVGGSAGQDDSLDVLRMRFLLQQLGLQQEDGAERDDTISRSPQVPLPHHDSFVAAADNVPGDAGVLSRAYATSPQSPENPLGRSLNQHREGDSGVLVAPLTTGFPRSNTGAHQKPNGSPFHALNSPQSTQNGVLEQTSRNGSLNASASLVRVVPGTLGKYQTLFPIGDPRQSSSFHSTAPASSMGSAASRSNAAVANVLDRSVHEEMPWPHPQTIDGGVFRNVMGPQFGSHLQSQNTGPSVEHLCSSVPSEEPVDSHDQDVIHFSRQLQALVALYPQEASAVGFGHNASDDAHIGTTLPDSARESKA